MTLSITVLGSSGMYATAERAASGYLVEFGDVHMWMDAGAGTWRNLLARLGYDRLDGVLLTHRHPDHTTDFFQAFHARRYGPLPTSQRIPLWAPPETLERLTAFIPEIDESFSLRTIGGGDSFEFGGARFSFIQMAHPAQTVGARIEHDSATLAYSADTGQAADFAALAGGADLFVCEATLQDSDELWEGHLRASQAGEIAATVAVKRLLLTHLPPSRDLDRSLREAHRVSDGVECHIASDGLRVEVGR